MSFDTERFIVEIENRPCLWNSALKDYSDRHLKIKCWDELANIFKETDEISNQERKDLSVILQKKWKSMRGCFTREVCRQKNLTFGYGSGSRKSEYIFFKQLQFLKPVISTKEPEHAADDGSVESVEKDKEVLCSKRRKIKDTIYDDGKLLETLNRNVEFRERKNANCEDEDRLFLLSLVGTLRKVPSERKLITKIKIMSLLEEATRNAESPVTYLDPHHQNSWLPSYQIDHQRGCSSERPPSVQSNESNSSNCS